MSGIDIGPVRVGKVQLGIGELPDQKIGNTLLSACADEQVWLGSPGHGQMGSQRRFVQCFWVLSQFGTLSQQLSSSLKHVPTATVIGGYSQMQGIVMRGTSLCLSDQILQARLKGRHGSIQISVDDLDNPELMQRFEQAQSQLSSALSRLLAVSENYPQLKADGLFRDLMTQLEGTENRIATERGRYVEAIQGYNVYIRQFPTVITAKIFGYKVKENYGVSRQDEITRDPEVRFDLPTPAAQPAG